jgi:hypothetical protein
MKKIELLIIENHKIGKLIINDVRELAKIVSKHKGKEKILLSSKHYYVSRLMHPCFEIENKFQDFDQIFQLISKYPQGQNYRITHTKERYITFMLEIYYISQIALFDRILHLINIVFELGLNDSYVRYEIISKNDRVDQKCKILLKNFFNHLEKNNTRSLQNQIKHKSRFRDDDLFTPSLIEFSLKTSSLDHFDKKSLAYLREDMKYYYKDYIKIKRKSIIDESEDLRKMTLNILDELYPFIKDKYKSFDK